VAIISAATALEFWPNENPIGRQIRPQFPEQQLFWFPHSGNFSLTIVGVVGDVREDGPILEGRHLPLIYLPYVQNPASLMHLVVRTSSNPMDLANDIRRQVWTVDPDQPVFDTKTMDDVVAEIF
jgi:putative ABC transport system permease protein